MANPTFVALTLPNYRVGVNGGTGDIPFGHGAFLVTNGSSNGSYYEYGQYKPDDFTNVNGVSSYSQNSAIRSVPVSGLEYDATGNLTQDSLHSALDQVFGSSGLYKSDTGMVIASAFPISPQQSDAINSFIQSQVQNITDGTERYGIGVFGSNNNDCLQFVFNAATSAGLTVASNQAGSGPAWPFAEAPLIMEQAQSNYQYFGPNSWKGSYITKFDPKSWTGDNILGEPAALNWTIDASVQGAESLGNLAWDFGGKYISNPFVTPAYGEPAVTQGSFPSSFTDQWNSLPGADQSLSDQQNLTSIGGYQYTQGSLPPAFADQWSTLTGVDQSLAATQGWTVPDWTQFYQPIDFNSSSAGITPTTTPTHPSTTPTSTTPGGGGGGITNSGNSDSSSWLDSLGSNVSASISGGSAMLRISLPRWGSTFHWTPWRRQFRRRVVRI